MPPTFQALSTLGQLRVCRFLTRGESPDDPEFAVVTREVGEHYQAQDPRIAVFRRWWPAVPALCVTVLTLPGAVDGELWKAIMFVLIVLGVVGNLMLNPWTRPNNVAKSVEASRRVVAQMSRREDRPR